MMEKYQILLIEDEEKTGSILKEALEYNDDSMDVTWKANGQEALEVMKASRFDLIVLDMKMPGMAGDEILEKIRHIDRYVQVVVYTNYPDAQQMKNLINFGVDGFIQKGGNVDLWDLVNKVKTMLKPFSEEERHALFKKMPEDLFHKDF